MNDVFIDTTNRADYEYWSKMSYWSLREALILSFGLEPSPRNVEPGSPEIVRRKELIQRAHHAGKLRDPIHPLAFLRWNESNELSFPAELEAMILKRHQGIPDWKAEALRLRQVEKRISEGFEYYRAQSEKKGQIIAELQKQIAELRGSKKAAADSKASSVQKSFNTILKLVGGMAIAVYNYNPHERRSDTIRQIQSDLDLKGITLDADTIRKWVREGAAHVEAAAKLSK